MVKVKSQQSTAKRDAVRSVLLCVFWLFFRSVGGTTWTFLKADTLVSLIVEIQGVKRASLVQQSRLTELRDALKVGGASCFNCFEESSRLFRPGMFVTSCFFFFFAPSHSLARRVPLGVRRSSGSWEDSWSRLWKRSQVSQERSQTIGPFLSLTALVCFHLLITFLSNWLTFFDSAFCGTALMSKS